MNRFKICRTRINETQKKIADFLGVDRTTYVKYETDSISAPSETVGKLADYFNVSIDYLLGRTEDPSPVRSAPVPVPASAPASAPVSAPSAPVLSPDELRLLDLFRTLNPSGRQMALTTLESFASNPSLCADTSSAQMA